jgi:hypothetical protein
MVLSDYRYYKKITIDSSKIDEDLTHFPLPVPLSSGTCSDIFSEVGSNYNKIAVFQGDQETQLYCEVEQWEPVNNKGLLWVSRDNWVVVSGTDTYIYLYFDAAASDNTTYVGTPGNRTEVWNSDFAAVYTMAQDPSGDTDCIIDSTSNGNHGTPAGSMTSGGLVDGEIGKAIAFDGTDDYIESSSNHGVTGSANRTIIVSIKTTNSVVVQRAFTIGNASTGEEFSVYFDGSGKFRIAITGGNRIWAETYADGNSHRIAIFLAGGSTNDLSCFFDGAAATIDSTVDTAINTADSHILIGVDTTKRYDFFDGQINDIQFFSTNLSAAWIKADYNAQTDNLLTFGSTELNTIGYFEGYIIEKNIPVSRTVYMYRRATGELLDKVTSSGTDGYFYVETFLDEAHNLVCLASGTNYSDLFYSKVYPTLF